MKTPENSSESVDCIILPNIVVLYISSHKRLKIARRLGPVWAASVSVFVVVIFPLLVLSVANQKEEVQYLEVALNVTQISVINRKSSTKNVDIKNW